MFSLPEIYLEACQEALSIVRQSMYMLQFIISLVTLVHQVTMFILNRVLIPVFFEMKTFEISLQSERHKVNVLYDIGPERGERFRSLPLLPWGLLDRDRVEVCFEDMLKQIRAKKRKKKKTRMGREKLCNYKSLDWGFFFFFFLVFE